MDSVITRRQVLKGLGAVGAATGFSNLASVAEAAQPTVRGTWLIKPATRRGTAGFEALAAFAAGGVFVTTGSDEAGTGLGEWSAGGVNLFAFTYVNFHFDSAQKLANTVKVRAAGTFDGSRLSGRATLSAFSPSGQRRSADLRFTFTGKRLPV
jgi:TAT (twin-arginine translocation) pathway signal sequence